MVITAAGENSIEMSKAKIVATVAIVLMAAMSMMPSSCFIPHEAAASVNTSLVVVGGVYCDQCMEGDLTVDNAPFAGANVTILCNNNDTGSSASATGTTDEFGEFKVSFEASLDFLYSPATQYWACRAMLPTTHLRSCSSHSSVEASSSSSSSAQYALSSIGHMEVQKSRLQYEAVYSVGWLHYQPKQPFPLCSFKKLALVRKLRSLTMIPLIPLIPAPFKCPNDSTPWFDPINPKACITYAPRPENPTRAHAAAPPSNPTSTAPPSNPTPTSTSNPTPTSTSTAPPSNPTSTSTSTTSISSSSSSYDQHTINSTTAPAPN